MLSACISAAISWRTAAATTMSLAGLYVVDREAEVTVNVAVDCPDLLDIDVRVGFDPAIVTYAGNAAWTARARGVEVQLSQAGDWVQFSTFGSLNDSVTVDAGTGVVFSFRLRGLAKGRADLLIPLYGAIHAEPVPGEETVVRQESEVTVLGPGPIQFSPAGATYVGPETISLASLDATGLYYTVNGDVPTTDAPDFFSTGPFAIDAGNGESVTVKVLATDDAGRTETGEQTYLFDKLPSADIVDVLPDPRQSGVDAVTVAFSEAVVPAAVGLDDLVLSRDGSGDLLTGGEQLATTDNVTWMLSGLLALTEPEGTYVLTLIAAGSGIDDMTGNALQGDASDTWVVDRTPPALTVTRDPDVDLLSGAYTFTIDGGDGVIVDYSLDGGDFVFYTEPVVIGTEGVHSFVGRTADAAGNATTAAPIAFTVDTTPPSGTLTIRPGDPPYATSHVVLLVSDVTDAVDMRFRNVTGGRDAFGDWEPYVAERSWSLAPGEGLREVAGEYRDLAGNVLSVTDSITVDTVAPMAAVSTAGVYGPQTWPGQIAGTAADATSGVSSVQLRILHDPDGQYWDGQTWGAGEVWLDAVGTTSWTSALGAGALTDGSGYTVDARATDAAGNVSELPTTENFQYDAGAPTGVFVVGVGGPDFVADTAVTLSISVSGATQFRFRNATGDFGAWQPIASTFAFDLLPVDGVKRVHGEFRDAVENVLAIFDDVGLDTTMPDSAITTSGVYGPQTWPGEIFGTANDGFSGVARVDVRVQRGDTLEFWNGAAWVAEESWLVSSGLDSWSVALAAGALTHGVTYTVDSRATDAAGNVDASNAQAFFSYDAEAPVGGMAIGAGDPSYVSGVSVTLQNTVAGATQMRFRNAGGGWSDWEAYAVQKAWTLDAGDGLKSVDAEFADTVSNSLETGDTTTLDGTAPVSVVETRGGYGPATWPDAVSGVVSDATSGVASVAVRIHRLEDGFFWTGTAWAGSEVWLAADLAGGAWSVSLDDNVALADTKIYGIQARGTDMAGNVETPAVETTFVFDASIPTGTFSVGTGNPTFVKTRDVTLINAIDGAEAMRFRNAGGAFTAWEDFASTKVWTLPANDGDKTVEAEFRNATGNILATSDTVTVDSVEPASAVATSGAFGPVTWPGSITGTVSDAVSGVAGVDVRIQRGFGATYWDGSTWAGVETWLPAAGVGSWTLTLSTAVLDDGQFYQIRSRGTDVAGNVETSFGDGLFSYDATSPTGALSLGVGGPTYATGIAVNLVNTVAGATQMRFRNAGGAWTDWQGIGATVAWTLTGGDGNKTVEGEFRDGVENTLALQDAVVLDTTDGTTTAAVNGAYGPTTWPGQLTGTAADVTSGVARVELLVVRNSDGFYWQGESWGEAEDWLIATGAISWQLDVPATTLTDGDSYVLRSRCVDAAGNVQASPTVNDFSYDATPPSGTLTIGVGDPTYTNTRSVTLVSSVEGAAQMRFRNEAAARAEFSDWLSFAVESDWVLATGDGPTRVAAEYRDEAGNVLAVTDQIVVDTVMPDSVVTTSGSFGPNTWSGVIEGTASDATSGVAMVELTLRRDADGQFWNGGAWGEAEIWLAADGTDDWSLPVAAAATLADGNTYTLASRATDRAANMGAPPAGGAFEYDAVAPVITVLPGTVELAYKSVAPDNAAFRNGVVATDREAGDLTGAVVVTGTVDTELVADQAVAYDVVDAAGNPAVRRQRVYRVGYVVSGRVDYNGLATGDSYVQALDGISRAVQSEAQVVGGTGDYAMFVFAAGDYVLRAFLDSSGNSAVDDGEPMDEESHPSVVIADTLTGIDFRLYEWAKTLNMKPGWNQVSVPGPTVEPSVAATFPGHAGSVWALDQGGAYAALTEVPEKQGMWLWYAAATSLRVRGVDAGDVRTDIAAGWNAVGVTGATVHPAAAVEPDLSIDPLLWQWLAAHQRFEVVLPSDVLQPFTVYWLYGYGATTIGP